MTTKVSLYRDKRNKHRPWIVRWFGEYDPTKGKQRQYSKAFARKRSAESFQAAKQAELDRGAPRDRPRDIGVGDFILRFLDTAVRNRRPATRYNYEFTLKQLEEFVGKATPLRSISAELADRFIATRTRVAKWGKGYSPWSRNRQLGNAKAAFNTAVRWSYISVNPFAHIRAERRAPRRWHYLRPDEFQTLLAVVDDLRWRVFYLLAYTTGARFGELFNLTWADIDFESCTITIQDRPPTADIPPFSVKDREARTLLLPRQTVEALTEWQGEAPEGVACILLTAERAKQVEKRWRLCRMGEPWKRDSNTGDLKWAEWENCYMVNNVIRDMRRHVRWAKLELTVPLTVHTLRKSFGQNHANAGTPMHVLQGLLGHASITTTREFYLQAPDANDHAALARYEALLKDAGAETCVRPAYEQDSTHPAKTTLP